MTESPEALVARTAAAFFRICGFALPAEYAALVATLIRERDAAAATPKPCVHVWISEVNVPHIWTCYLCHVRQASGEGGRAT